MPEPSLELIQSMLQRLLDGQNMLRDDVRNVRRRMSRFEASMVALQRFDLDAQESEGSIQEQVDGLAARVERLERTTTTP